MSKKLFALGCLVLALMLCTAAVAEPLLTNGSYTAFLGQNNWLYLQAADGSTRHLKVAIADIVGIDEEKMYCVTNTGALWSVNLDGSASAILSSRPREDDFAAVAVPAVYTLENGVLTLLSTGEVMSNSVVAACATPVDVYMVEEQPDGQYMLITRAVDGSEGGRSMMVSKPIAINASMDYVCIVTEQHSVQVIQLSCWGMLEFPAISDKTAAAIFVKDNLIRFTKNEVGDYEVESVDKITASFVPTATPRPTFTPRPTATVRPAVTPAAEQNAAVVSYGESSEAVANMQKRLVELGYLKEANGVFDDATLKALNLFQYAVGHTERAYASERLLQLLNSENAVRYDPYMTLCENDRGTPVLEMQQWLIKKGYAVTANGIYGKETVRAAAQFLADTGFEADGTVMNAAMLMTLYRE